WIAADRTGNFVWGPGGVSNHPTQHGPSCDMNAATWGDVPPGTPVASSFGDSYTHPQCEDGDDDDLGYGCIRQCRPGNTNTGLFCSTSTDTYARQHYGYDWRLPTSDRGLLLGNPY